MNATADGIAAFHAFISDAEADIHFIFRVERAYEVDTLDIDEGWLP
ncbi:hypothetical protein OH733_05550 [Streptomyces griseus]|uniref:Uncharacterized protein n=1 Tax=Streptomyces phage Paedore TaxID=2108134 RepID=A0A2P1JTP8_9CAUD|nr:hypothetical protein KGG91_gp37 [Streptomyces phage Paedore]AVO22520.1 hypothetical protein PBI_PAEDORE_37 [Streptomyces phage Paedore]WTC86237.1 hypothetical protein OH733_05550 [Streptomyces griseus]WTD71145.1 hypothetical protein OH763_31435 [Streptomyces griseus]